MTSWSLDDRIAAMVATVERDEREIGVLSTGEQIAVAVVLDRRALVPAPYDDSWQDALDRLGEDWLAACRRVQARRDRRDRLAKLEELSLSPPRSPRSQPPAGVARNRDVEASMTTGPERPRLGDRDLRIEVNAESVDAYYAYARRHDPSCGDRAQAERDLLDTLREAYILGAEDDLIRVRYYSRRRNIDLRADVLRVSPTQVRCLRVDIYQRSASGGQTHGGNQFRIAGGGAVRVNPDGSLSRRHHQSPEWRPCSLASLLEYPADHRVWRWLSVRGYRRPSPSQPEEKRAAKQCLLRLRPETIAQLDELAQRWGLDRSAAVTRLVAQASGKR